MYIHMYIYTCTYKTYTHVYTHVYIYLYIILHVHENNVACSRLSGFHTETYGIFLHSYVNTSTRTSVHAITLT